MSTFGFEGKSFLLDGKPYTIISGAMHYWRIVPEYWEDRLKKLKACGFNTLETYIPWNLHERREGEFDFSGRLDVVKYVSIAEKLGLRVIIRPGPYICSEFDFGGLPSWLLRYPDISLRCRDPRYLEKVRPYYRELFSRLRPHLCTNGGGIIMVQIENEYGSYGDDKEYLNAVADIYRECGVDCQLFTSDGPCWWMLGGGTLPQYLSVANFGSAPEKAFELLEEFRPGQPLMCGEFWCGWFDHWGEEHHVRGAEDTVDTMKRMLKLGASFNFYMFHGGTNFGFTNGANHDGKYRPTVTSYDYCAPLSEAGDLTETYHKVREAIAEHTGVTPSLDGIENSRKAAYGRLVLTEKAPLFPNLERISSPVRTAAPKSMEELGQDFGYILYSSVLEGRSEELPLELEHVHDRALVYINGEFSGIRERSGRRDEIKLKLEQGEKKRIDLLVENCGRINYGVKLLDKKGVIGGIRLGQKFHFGWDNYCLPMEDLSALRYESDTVSDGRPAFLRGWLEIEAEPADTFVRLDGFKKGFVKVNGFNIGRYWNEAGPQKTLYIPAPLLHTGRNEIVVFESDGYEAPAVEFLAEPDLG